MRYHVKHKLAIKFANVNPLSKLGKPALLQALQDIGIRVKPLPPAHLVGNKIEIDGELPMLLTPPQAAVVRVLVQERACSLSRLRDLSSIDDANKQLTRLLEAHACLRAYIRLPVKAGRGGYSTTIAESGE